MANLVKCSDCGKKVSINAHSCPKCGAILSEQNGFHDAKQKLIQKNEREQKRTEDNKKFLSQLIAVIVGFFAFLTPVRDKPHCNSLILFTMSLPVPAEACF